MRDNKLNMKRKKEWAAQRWAKTFSPFMVEDFDIEDDEEEILTLGDTDDEADEVITEEDELKATIYKMAIRREQEENHNLRVYGAKNPNRAERHAARKNHMERISNGGVKIKHLCEEGEKKWVEYHEPKHSYKDRLEAAKVRAAMSAMDDISPVSGVTLDDGDPLVVTAQFVSFGEPLWKHIPEPFVDHSADEECEQYDDELIAALSKYISENEQLRKENKELNERAAWLEARLLIEEDEYSGMLSVLSADKAKLEGEKTYWERRAREAEAREAALKLSLKEIAKAVSDLKKIADNFVALC